MVLKIVDASCFRREDAASLRNISVTALGRFIVGIGGRIGRLVELAQKRLARVSVRHAGILDASGGGGEYAGMI